MPKVEMRGKPGKGGGGEEEGSPTVFYGSPGDDTLRGGRAEETVVYSGSIWDYDISPGRKGKWIVTDLNPADGDTGTDTLGNIDWLQFDDARMSLTSDNPLIVTAPDTVRLTVGDTADITLVGVDYDGGMPRIDYLNYASNRQFGDVRIGEYDQLSSSTGGLLEKTYRYTTFDGYHYPYVGSPLTEKYSHVSLMLAEGEILEQDLVFLIYSQDESVRVTVNLEVVGVNDAPVLADSDRRLHATDGVLAATLDLAALGSDIDSDDDGSTLTYKLLSATDGFGISIDGTELTVAGGAATAGLDSDESLTGEMTLVAVDSHGAVSNEITLQATVTGSGRPTEPYLTADDGIDWAAMGIVPGEGLTLPVLDGSRDDPAYPDLLTFTEGDDVFQLNTPNLQILQWDSFFYESYATQSYDRLPIYTAGGNDTVVLSLASETRTIVNIVDLYTGLGDDTVVIEASSPGQTYADGLTIDTNAGSDQVLVRLNGGRENLFNADIYTGSGHDIVDIRMIDGDPTGLHGYQTVNGDFSLGSGDDVLNIVVTGENAFSSAALLTHIDAGAGDDRVLYSNAGVTLRDDARLYFGGFNGEIDLGDGEDVLVLDLSEALGVEHELFVDGGTYGPDEYDVLTLAHLTADSDFTAAWKVEGRSVRLTHNNQIIEITDIEEIRLGDGADLFEFL